jgi:hypothetical protein
MNLSKKLLSVFLAFVMLLIALPISNINSFASDASDFVYTVIDEDEKTAEITGYNGSGGDVVIPSVIDGYTIISLGDSVFGENYDIETLTLSSVLQSITPTDLAMLFACSAFYVESGNLYFSAEDGVLYNVDKTELIMYPSQAAGSTFSIPNTVLTIGMVAFLFSNCEEIIIPDSVEEIHEMAFAYSENLTRIVLSDSVTSLPYGAFAYCSSLNNVVLSPLTTEIFEYAFLGCSSLEELFIPRSVLSISQNAFEDAGLTTIYGIPNTAAETFANDNNYTFVATSDVPGDVNKDLVCDGYDIDMMMSIAAGLVTPSDFQVQIGDVVSDDIIDGFDIAKLDLGLSA